MAPSMAHYGGPPEPTDYLSKCTKTFYQSILMQDTDELDPAVLPWPGG